MSLTLALFNGLSGLQTNQTALQVTSDNIANLNTEGYSRKIHEQTTRLLGDTGAGVMTARIIRKVDEFLRRDLIKEASAVTNAEVRAEFFDRMQQLFGSVGSDNALGNSITNLALAMEDVANNPDVAAQRFTATGEADNVSRNMQRMAADVQDLRADTDRRITNAMGLLNTTLESITDLNSRIATNLRKGAPTSDLLDQRDLALATLSEHFDIQHFNDAEGMTWVLTKGGSKLIAGTTAAVFDYTASATMTATLSYPSIISGINLDGADVTSELTGGKIEALVEMRDTVLPAMTDQLDLLSANLRDSLNQIHNRGANTPFGNGQAGADDPAMYGSRIITTPTDVMTLSDSVTFQILDSNGDPATGAMTLAAGATTAAFVATSIDTYLDTGIDFGEAAFVNNRLEIKLEPGYRLAIQDNGPAADSGDATITFDADGDTFTETYLGFSNFFGLNDLYQTPDLNTGDPVVVNQGASLGISSTLKVRQDIIDNPDYLSRGILRPSAVDFHLGAGDNEIIQQLAAAFDETLTFTAVANGPPQTSTSFAGYAGTILSYNAASARDAENTLEFNTFFFENLENRVNNEAGVNLDEELSNMVIFQNAYSASARIVQAVDELFDILLSLA